MRVSTCRGRPATPFQRPCTSQLRSKWRVPCYPAWPSMDALNSASEAKGRRTATDPEDRSNTLTGRSAPPCWARIVPQQRTSASQLTSSPPSITANTSPKRRSSSAFLLVCSGKRWASGAQRADLGDARPRSSPNSCNLFGRCAVPHSRRRLDPHAFSQPSRQPPGNPGSTLRPANRDTPRTC